MIIRSNGEINPSILQSSWSPKAHVLVVLCRALKERVEIVRSVSSPNPEEAAVQQPRQPRYESSRNRESSRARFMPCTIYIAQVKPQVLWVRFRREVGTNVPDIETRPCSAVPFRMARTSPMLADYPRTAADHSSLGSAFLGLEGVHHESRKARTQTDMLQYHSRN